MPDDGVATKPEVNVLSLPGEIYPPAPPEASAPRPAKVRRPRTPSRVFAEQPPEQGRVNVLGEDFREPPREVSSGVPAGASLPPKRMVAEPSRTNDGGSGAGEDTSEPAGTAIRGVLSLLTAPALEKLGLAPAESEEILEGIVGALDTWSEGGAHAALPIPPGVKKVSKAIEKIAPVAKKVLVPRIPAILQAIKDLTAQNAPPPEPAPAPPEASVPRSRLGSQELKRAVKAQAGKTVEDKLGGRMVSFPEEMSPEDVGSRVPQEAVQEWSSDGPVRRPGSVRPPAAPGAGQSAPAKIQFYNEKGAQDKPSKPSIADASPAEIERAAAPRESMSPANLPEHGLSDERRDALVRPPANLAAATKPAEERPRMEPTPTPTPTPSRSRLTAAERDLILGAVRGQDPSLIAGVIMAGLDVSSMALAQASTLKPEQRARLKALRFEELLAEGEAMARTDQAFQQRWAVVMKPNGRKWLAKTLKAIQGGL